MYTDWNCRVRNGYSRKKYLPLSSAGTNHPLKEKSVGILSAVKHDSNKFKNGNGQTKAPLFDPINSVFDGDSDPLTRFAMQDELGFTDPLTSAAHDSIDQLDRFNKPSQKSSSELDSMMNWKLKRGNILTQYTTTERLTITTSFLNDGELSKNPNVSEKVKNRLEQLDDFDECSVRQMMNLTQQEYTSRIEQLNQELVVAWNSDQRVKALKIAIQCSKLLADTSVIQFYPSKFVLITDILDIFGKLVYDRLLCKSDKPEEAKATSEAARETCLNWFYKIASIRELLPRFYVETAILRSYTFLSIHEYNEALSRLCKMVRGIGDPLVSVYARCYLCRMGVSLPANRLFFLDNFDDFLLSYSTVFSKNTQSELSGQRMTLTNYLSLYSPAIEWMLQGFSVYYTSEDLTKTVQQCKKINNNGLLLLSIITAFPTEYLWSNISDMIQIIKGFESNGISQSMLFKALGTRFIQSNSSGDLGSEDVHILMKIFETLTNPADYIHCIDIWIPLFASKLQLSDIDQLLGNIVNRMNKENCYESFYTELQQIAHKIMTNTNYLEKLIVLQSFNGFLQLFQKESIKIDVCKTILSSYETGVYDCTNDPVLINTLKQIAVTLNDTVNARTFEDEVRQIGHLISVFIKRVKFRDQVEQQLKFYVDCRSSFSNLDSVLVTLIHCVNKLCMDVRKLSNGQHTKKTGAFVRACVAYSFISIPSITSVLTKMELYLLSGEVALINECLGQADDCFQAALRLIPELPITIEVDGKPKKTEPYLISFLTNYLSVIIVNPDSPDQGVLYLFRLLLEMIEKYQFDSNSAGSINLYLNILESLCVSSQPEYPYHIENVVSNDELYGSDALFIGEINSLCSDIIEIILNKLKILGDNNQVRIQCSIALELLIKIVESADLSKGKISNLAFNLWNLAMKNKSSLDPNTPGRILKKLENIMAFERNEALDQLLAKMKLKM